MKLEDYLQWHASRIPDKVAIVCNSGTCTYKQLFDLVEKRVEKIRYGHHKIIPFHTSQSLEFLINYFAIHLSDCIAAPLEKDIPNAMFEKISDSLRVCKVPDNTADILYTTGTTGTSKGVIISHHAIISNAENLLDAHKYSEDLTFIISGPLNHIGNLSKVYPIIILGATLYITEGMKDINAFYNALDYPCSKIATFLVPAAIRMLIKFSTNRLSKYVDKIDFIETGAAPISQKDMSLLCRIFPKSRLYNTYASTEAGIIATYDFNDGKCQEDCVGKPMRHSTVEISDFGTIICKGSTLMSGYISDSSLTDSVLHNGFLTTQDVGFIDAEGMLHLQGRNDDIINIGGYKVAPTEVESIALSMKGIEDCICIAVDHPIMGKALKLLVVTNKEMMVDNKTIASFFKSKLESYKIPLLYQYVHKIKRTFNGKLDRKAYVG